MLSRLLWVGVLGCILGGGLVEPTGLASRALANGMKGDDIRPLAIDGWKYDPATGQLEFEIADGVKPRHFLMAQPARIIVDLPSTQVGGAFAAQDYATGPIKRITTEQLQPQLVRITLFMSPDAVFARGQVAIDRLDDGKRGLSDVWAIRPLLAGAAPIAAAPIAPTPAVTNPAVTATVAAPITAAITAPIATPIATPIEPRDVPSRFNSAIEPALPPGPADLPPGMSGVLFSTRLKPGTSGTTPTIVPPVATNIPPTLSAPIVTAPATAPVDLKLDLKPTSPKPIATAPIATTPTVTTPTVATPIGSVSIPPVAIAPVAAIPAPPAAIPTAPSAPPAPVFSVPSISAVPPASAPVSEVIPIAVPSFEVARIDKPQNLVQNAVQNTVQNIAQNVPQNIGQNVPQDSAIGNALKVDITNNPALAGLMPPAPIVAAPSSLPPNAIAATPIPDSIPAIVPSNASGPATVTVPPLSTISPVPAQINRPAAPAPAMPNNIPPSNIPPSNILPSSISPSSISPSNIPPSNNSVPLPDRMPTVEPVRQTIAEPFSQSGNPAVSQPIAQPMAPIMAQPIGQPLEQQAIASNPGSVQPNLIQFGQPLEGTKNTPVTSVNSLPPTVPAGRMMLPMGTVLSVRYTGISTLKVQSGTAQQEILVLQSPIRDRMGNVLAPEGTSIYGSFEGGGMNRFVARAIVLQGQTFSLQAESGSLGGGRNPSERSLLQNSGIGALAGILIGGLSGGNFIGGAAAGAAITYATTPARTEIKPGQTLELKLTQDWILPIAGTAVVPEPNSPGQPFAFKFQ